MGILLGFMFLVNALGAVFLAPALPGLPAAPPLGARARDQAA
jgi:hypothetical protein